MGLYSNMSIVCITYIVKTSKNSRKNNIKLFKLCISILSIFSQNSIINEYELKNET